MSFDGLFTYCMTEELQVLTGGRITKIQQPGNHEIVLAVRSRGKTRKCLLSAHPSYARVHLTEEPYDHPKEAPRFCMVLRKHLEGFFIEKIFQPGLERIITFRIRGRDEIGERKTKLLIAEIMGKHSNIILLDEQTGTIIDSIKHIPSSVNRHRTVLPGHRYLSPPEQHKKNPFEARPSEVEEALLPSSGSPAKALVSRFQGLSPLLAEEIVWQAKETGTIGSAFVRAMERIRRKMLEPMLIKGDKKEYFYLFDLGHITGQRIPFPTLSALLDRYYFGKAERDRVKEIAGGLEKLIRNEIEKNKRKLQKLEETKKEAENLETYRLYGELLTANLYRMEKGMASIEVENYYETDLPTVTIPLQPEKSPSENAQLYFRKYEKAKNALKAVSEQTSRALEEIRYFESLLQQLESASPADIEEIREELEEQGYVRKKNQRQKNRKTEPPRPEIYRSTDGTEILVGKNHKQNEYLTMKLAKKEDLWLHTKDIPGSHVVIRSPEPSEQTILEAATIAAYFSKARHSASVPVDYTRVKYVKKPSGAKPGFVIYDHQKTVYVTPDVELIRALKPEK